MNRPPAFQFYPKDWLSSQSVQLMSLEEVGAYIVLLCHCWNTDDCTIPDDDRQLAIFSRMGDRWLSYGVGMNPVRAQFVAHPSKSGRLINRRLYQEFVKLKKISKERSASGRKGAETRWNRNGSHNGSAIPQPMAKNSSSSSSSSSLKRDRERSGARIASELNGHGPNFEVFWAAYPKKEGKGACRTWWNKHQPDDVLLGVMLSKIEQAKQTRKWQDENGRFIPMPLTWLRQARWEDDYAAASKKHAKPYGDDFWHPTKVVV